MKTFKFILLNKVFCERMVKMLAAEGVAATYEVCTDYRWRPIGQTLVVDGLDNASIVVAVRKVTKEYARKYSLKNISYFVEYFLKKNKKLSTNNLIESGWD